MRLVHLTCEGVCGGAAVLAFDAAVRAMEPALSQADGKAYRATDELVSLRQDLVYTVHETDDKRAVCRLCGHDRQYGVAGRVFGR